MSDPHSDRVLLSDPHFVRILLSDPHSDKVSVSSKSSKTGVRAEWRSSPVGTDGTTKGNSPTQGLLMFMIMVTIIIVIITAVITFPIIKTTRKNIESNGSLQKDITNALFQKFDHCSSQIITIITNTIITIIITTIIMIMIRRSPPSPLS